MKFNKLEIDERIKTDLADLIEKIRKHGKESNQVKSHILETVRKYETRVNRVEYLECAEILLYAL